jgi:hypothetical protein
VLYGANEFKIGKPEDFCSFLAVLPKAHLRRIRCLQLGWYFNYFGFNEQRDSAAPTSFSEWKEVIRVISEEIPALLRLTVALGYGIRLYPYCCLSLAEPARPPTGCESQIFDLLKTIRTPKHFEVLTNWPVTKELAGDAPFRLIETIWEKEPGDFLGDPGYHSDLLHHNFHQNSYENRADAWIKCGDRRVNAKCVNASPLYTPPYVIRCSFSRSRPRRSAQPAV